MLCCRFRALKLGNVLSAQHESGTKIADLLVFVYLLVCGIMLEFPSNCIEFGLFNVLSRYRTLLSLTVTLGNAYFILFLRFSK